MRPNDEADRTDRSHCVGHSEITEHRLFGEGRDDMADQAKGWQDDDVHLRMTEEPE